MHTFFKPSISFPRYPLIYAYIEHSYNKINSLEEFIDFIHNCLNEAEISKNEVKKKSYQNLALALFSLETNISYESKSIELIVKNL